MKWDGNDLHVVVDHPNRYGLDDRLFQEIVFESDQVNIVDRKLQLLDILVQSGLFKSRNDARKNWNRSFVMKEGMNRFERFGKLKRNIYILCLPETLMAQEAFETEYADAR